MSDSETTREQKMDDETKVDQGLNLIDSMSYRSSRETDLLLFQKLMEQYPVIGKIIDCVKSVYAKKGHNRDEVVYEKCLRAIFRKMEIVHKSQFEIRECYDGIDIDHKLRTDLFVEDQIILELKALVSLTENNIDQLRNYLLSMPRRVGILINFPKKYTTTLDGYILYYPDYSSKCIVIPLRLPVEPEACHKLNVIGTIRL